MYDALGLAMQADNRPQEEIERVLMSAVNFASTPMDLMYIGGYLEQNGFPQRALQVFQQVARMVPGQPEPFVAGFRVAQRCSDLEGIKWSTVGILCRPWPNDQAEIWKDAVHEAKATLAHLKANRRTAKEAKAYEKSLDEAIARDCYVKVSWTGDADLDLFVEEPAGTVCSGQNPWTTSGGALLGQTLARWSKEMNGRGESSAVYVCPQGFSGNYRLLVRRVFGKVVGDKVTVEVCTHYLTDKQQTVKQAMKLIKDQTAVAFQLADGRRREPLKQQQVANAALGQLATRQVLGQQIAQAVDPRTMMALNQALRGGLASCRARAGESGGRRRGEPGRRRGGESGRRRQQRQQQRRRRQSAGQHRGRLPPALVPRRRGLPAGDHHPARGHQPVGHGRGLGRPPLRPCLLHAAVLRRGPGQHLQYVHRGHRADQLRLWLQRLQRHLRPDGRFGIFASLIRRTGHAPYSSRSA